MDPNKISWFINFLYLVFKLNRKINAQEKMYNDAATMEKSMAFPQKPNMKFVQSIAIHLPECTQNNLEHELDWLFGQPCS